MADIEWGEPPIGGNVLTGVNWSDVAAKLKANPGQWGKIHTYPKGQGARNARVRIQNGKQAAFRPAGSFEAASRGQSLWARYVGEDATDG